MEVLQNIKNAINITTIGQAVKLSTSAAIDITLGGLVKAVMPPKISIIYKAASYVGSAMLAWYVNDKMNDFVDEKMKNIEECINDLKTTQKSEVGA